jgi:hypothetical protein
MSRKVTDEMLMAYVDGELDPATRREVERAAAADEAVRARIEAFQSSRLLAREVFADVMARPVPDRLMKLLAPADKPLGRAVSWWRGRWAMVPIAAALALAAGVGGYFYGQGGATTGGGLLGGAELASLIAETPGGEERLVVLGDGEATYRTLGTYRVEGGECRIFEVFGEGAGGALRGVGCDRGAGWGVDIAAMQGDPMGITPASQEALAGIDAYLDALEAEGPIELE